MRHDLRKLAGAASFALGMLAESIDAAGPSPGDTTRELLADDRSEAVTALRALASALPPGPDRTRARAQAAIVAHPEAAPQRVVESGTDAMRGWARAWERFAAEHCDGEDVDDVKERREERRAGR